MDFLEYLRGDLEARLTPHRFEHTLNVAHLARELAEKNGLDADKAYLTGFLHDCAKYMKGDELIEAAKMGGADEFEMQNHALLHAPAGAYRAKTRYGINDEEILHSIRRHTVGAIGMTRFDAVIQVADQIEPTRGDFPGRAEVAEAAENDIMEALLLVTENKLRYVKSRGGFIHPNAEKIIKLGRKAFVEVI